MVALGIFQALLNGIGWILAWIYDVVGNFGVSIIVLTILIRVVLLPLGIKQIKSMQAMQAIQPKIKEIQKKYKGNKQKAQEETMKLYKEAGVNPLGGCLPLLLQFPILIAMYAVIRPPQLLPVTVDDQPAYAIHNNHLPVDSQLFQDIIEHQHLGFLGLNLQCSASQSGKPAPVTSTDREPVTPDTPILDTDEQPLPFDATTGTGTIPCGTSTADRIPYFVMLILMIGTTFYQQRQMQKASPPGAASGQQQAILKLMPIMFGFFGYAFPAGLVLYWTTSNLWQIGQQYALLRAGHIGPEAMERRMAEQKARANGPQPAKQGFFARLMEQAGDQQAKRAGSSKSGGAKGSGSTKGGGSKSTPPRGGTGSGAKGGQKPSGSKGAPPPPSGRTRSRRPNTGQGKTPRKPTDPMTPSGGDDGDGEAGS
ncbi:MAG TPA: YidC/Oxa1 family membrane protein insertase [Actinomycetota bacterium]|jgi:YidC/Oxa1 family membrane protein insertase